MAVIMATVIVADRTLASHNPWEDTLGGVDLFANSGTGRYSDHWEGSGQSTASANITSISVDTEGREWCDPNWVHRWDDSDSNSNDDFAQADGWWTYGCGEYPQVCVRATSDHNFQNNSPFFVANPGTDHFC
jgi:hypothetical protein